MKRRLTAALITGIVVVLFPMSVGHASASTTLVVQTHNAQHGTNAPFDVECPVGMQAISGGVELSHPDQMTVVSSEPTFNGTQITSVPMPSEQSAATGWSAGVYVSSGSGWSFSVAATCMKLGGNIGPTRVEVASVSASDGEVSCSDGMQAVGGGVDASASSPVGVIATSFPVIGNDGVATGWRVGVRGGGAVAAAVVCANQNGLPSTTTQIASASLAGQATSTASCSDLGAEALGGGISLDDPDQTALVTSMPVGDSGSAASGWTGQGTSDGGGTHDMYAAVICETTLKGGSAPAATPTASATPSPTISASPSPTPSPTGKAPTHSASPVQAATGVIGSSGADGDNGSMWWPIAGAVVVMGAVAGFGFWRWKRHRTPPGDEPPPGITTSSNL